MKKPSNNRNTFIPPTPLVSRPNNMEIVKDKLGYDDYDDDDDEFIPKRHSCPLLQQISLADFGDDDSIALEDKDFFNSPGGNNGDTTTAFHASLDRLVFMDESSKKTKRIESIKFFMRKPGSKRVTRSFPSVVSNDDGDDTHDEDHVYLNNGTDKCVINQGSKTPFGKIRRNSRKEILNRSSTSSSKTGSVLTDYTSRRANELPPSSSTQRGTNSRDRRMSCASSTCSSLDSFAFDDDDDSDDEYDISGSSDQGVKFFKTNSESVSSLMKSVSDKVVIETDISTQDEDALDGSNKYGKKMVPSHDDETTNTTTARKSLTDYTLRRATDTGGGVLVRIDDGPASPTAVITLPDEDNDAEDTNSLPGNFSYYDDFRSEHLGQGVESTKIRDEYLGLLSPDEIVQLQEQWSNSFTLGRKSRDCPKIPRRDALSTAFNGSRHAKRKGNTNKKEKRRSLKDARNRKSSTGPHAAATTTTTERIPCAC